MTSKRHNSFINIFTVHETSQIRTHTTLPMIHPPSHAALADFVFPPTFSAKLSPAFHRCSEHESFLRTHNQIDVIQTLEVKLNPAGCPKVLNSSCLDYATRSINFNSNS